MNKKYDKASGLDLLSAGSKNDKSLGL